MSNEYWNKYYTSLVGARILAYCGMEGEEEDLNGFPTFTVRFANGDTGQIEISQDPEGNGGGFIFGLLAPERV